MQALIFFLVADYRIYNVAVMKSYFGNEIVKIFFVDVNHYVRL